MALPVHSGGPEAAVVYQQHVTKLAERQSLACAGLFICAIWLLLLIDLDVDSQ